MPEAVSHAITAPTSARTWALWLALTVIAWGGIAAMVQLSATFGLYPAPLWALPIQFTLAPAIGVAAAIAPLVALGALVLKRWRGPLLVLLGIVAALQLASVGFEFSVQQLAQERANTFEGWPQ